MGNDGTTGNKKIYHKIYMENDETPVIKENFHKICFKFKISSFLMIKINMENDGTPRNKQNSTNRFISDLFQSHYLA